MHSNLWLYFAAVGGIVAGGFCHLAMATLGVAVVLQLCWQSGVLGTIAAATQAGVYGALAFACGQAAGWFATHPRAAAWTARIRAC